MNFVPCLASPVEATRSSQSTKGKFRLDLQQRDRARQCRCSRADLHFPGVAIPLKWQMARNLIGGVRFARQRVDANLEGIDDL